MPHQRPGWAMSNGHIVRSQSEASLCEYLNARNVVHVHWALNFELPTSPKEWRLFVPSIVLTELKCDDRTVIIEPVNSIQIGGGVRRLQSFRKRHSREYYVIVVTRRVFHRRIPEDAYDAIFHVEDFSGLGELLHQQGKPSAKNSTK
ncbi:MAG TPA: hypothetical protein VJL59_21335 [Anaerolineales bacterium]|nr:hypothetical protein [Anaerolineales bacterium]